MRRRTLLHSLGIAGVAIVTGRLAQADIAPSGLLLIVITKFRDPEGERAWMVINNVTQKFTGQLKIKRIDSADADKETLVREIKYKKLPLVILYKSDKIVFQNEGLVKTEELVKAIKDNL